MTLQSFCKNCGWPPATASRLVRGHVFEQAFGMKDPAEETLRAESLDVQIQGAGIRVRKPAGNTRLHYDIERPADLDRWLATQANRPPLNDEQVDLLLEAAELLVKADRGEGKTRLFDTEGKQRRYLTEEFRDRLEGLLRRAGRLEH